MGHIIRFDEGYRFDAGWYWDQLVPDHPPKKGAMAEYFIPRNWALYREWLLNMKTEIPTEGPKFGLVAGDITAIQATCQAQIDKIDAYTAAQSAVSSALETLRDGKAITDTALSEEITDWKTETGWDDAIAAKLRVASGAAADVNLDDYKAEFTVKIVGGEIRIEFKKKGVEGMRVYMRRKGQTAWTFLALDTSSPYIDSTPLATPGVAEVREYMLRGVIKDEEIGKDSDIQSIAWGGN